MTVSDFRDQILAHDQVRVIGTGSRQEWCTPWSGPQVSTRGLAGIDELSVDDRLVTVRSGTLIVDLLAELAEYGLSLPLPTSGPELLTQRYGTVGGIVMAGLPPFGTWGGVRDWVLAMEVMRGDGTTAKVGAKVAKSVAGYDGQRFFVGSRGGLVAALNVTFRLWPSQLFETLSAPPVASEVATIWHSGGSPHEVNWSTGSAQGDAKWWFSKGGARSGTAVSDIERRAKQVIDPNGRFVEGWQV